jgi:putative membrane protein
MTSKQTKHIGLTAIFGASLALTTATLALAQDDGTERNRNVPPTGIRAATLDEMNGGKRYLGMNHPSTLPASLQTTPDAIDFMRKAAIDGMTEVKLGELAQSNGSSDAVKEFGRHMVADHTMANRQLTHLASDLGVDLPANLDSKHQALYNRLSRLSGPSFDRAYARAMLDAHEKAVHLFTARANNGRNTDLRSWTATTVPTLRKHLDMAHDLYASVMGHSSHGMP